MGKGFTPIESYSFFTWRDHSLPSDSHFAEDLAIKINDIEDFLISSVFSVFHFCSVPYFIKIRNIGILPYIERPAYSSPAHFPTFVSTTPTSIPYLLYPTDIATLITSYPIDLAIVLTTYPSNLATLLITYPTNLTIVLTTYPTNLAILHTQPPY